MRTIEDAHIASKKVLLRTDYNVPILDGKIGDTYRIDASFSTIKYLLDHEAKHITIVTHLGRPEGKHNSEFSTRPIKKYLVDKLDHQDKVELLENIRFDPREEKNEPSLAKELSHGEDLYIDDAFGNVHRDHASMTAITKYLPSFAGLLVEKEVSELDRLRQKPDRPFIVILGGAKADEKVPLIKNLIHHVDYFILGGVPANVFLAASGMDIKKSVVDQETVQIAKEFLEQHHNKFVLPAEFVWDEDKIVDFGPKAINRMVDLVGEAKEIFWNGSLSLTEDGFESASKQVGEAVAKALAYTVVSGGDTVSYLDSKLHNLDQFNFVSTGGGATLQYLAGEKLPALEALE